MDSAIKSAYIVLFSMILWMGALIVVLAANDIPAFTAYLGFARGESGNLISWLCALIIAALYIKSASKNTDIRRYLFKLDFLKAAAIVAAVCAGIVEEMVFRKWIMDYLHGKNFSIYLQIVLSGLAFGLAHLLWGLRNYKAGINAALSTTILGTALACVYVIGDRSLAPCIAAHFIITAMIEPGLVISAARDRLGFWSEKSE
ncbi:CPBP family intramembrane glutamic endopeptidase [Halioglobus japonicus]|nr:CPBP family intramembrane glutamic endopeptidase [Halioglobus japonicus]